MIGCGGVGYALLEVFNKEKLFNDAKFIIIEPRQIIDINGVMKNRQYIHIKTSLTRENHKQLLKDCEASSYIINVSVNVDSIMLLKHAKINNSFYIDTSLEQYQDFIHVNIDEITNYEQFKKNNLYHQNLEAFKTIGKSRRTRIISGGMNPAFINEYTKRALVEYGKLKGIKLDKGNYAKLGFELELKEVQVVEYDCQKMKVKSTQNLFVSDWSPYGLMEEGGDLVMLSLNNDDIKKLEKSYNLIKPNEGDKNTHIRFIAERGIDLKRKSFTLDDKGNPFIFEGMLIPHSEIITMSEFFNYKGDSPSISYIYHPCEEAIRGLEFFRKNDYKILPDFLTVRNKDVISGWDSICCLLKFKNGDNFIAGTICGVKDARRMKFKSNATVIQVAAFMVGAICWSLKNPSQGLNNAETIPNAFIFDMGEKYMGLSIKGKLVKNPFEV